MSKIVVGMNSRPAIMPQRIDCGFRKTVPKRGQRARQPVVAPARASPASGSRTKSSALIARPAMPMPIQKRAPGNARRRSSARRRTGRPSRRPCRTSASRRSASRRARPGSSWWRCRPRRRARRRRPRPAGSGRRSRAWLLPEREQQRADADHRRADRDHLARPQPVHRRAGHQAERRIAVVEEADQRGDARGAEAEGLRQLRHHDGRRRAQRVLIEVVHRRDQPGDAGRF